MDLSSFLTSLGTSFMIFLVLMFAFAWLSRRPSNHVVYYPNRILKGLDPYEGMRRTRNPFAWIREAITSTEADVIRMSIVDTAVYFVFLTTGEIHRRQGGCRRVKREREREQQEEGEETLLPRSTPAFELRAITSSPNTVTTTKS